MLQLAAAAATAVLPARRAWAQGASGLSLERPGAPTRPGATPATPASLGRTALLLVVICGSMLVAHRIVRRLVPPGGRGDERPLIELLGHCTLGTKGTIYAVRCGPRLLLVGATASQLSTLSELADPEEIDEVLAACGRGVPGRQPHLAAADTSEAMPRAGDPMSSLLEKIHGWKAAA